MTGPVSALAGQGLALRPYSCSSFETGLFGITPVPWRRMGRREPSHPLTARHPSSQCPGLGWWRHGGATLVDATPRGTDARAAPKVAQVATAQRPVLTAPWVARVSRLSRHAPKARPTGRRRPVVARVEEHRVGWRSTPQGVVAATPPWSPVAPAQVAAAPLTVAKVTPTLVEATTRGVVRKIRYPAVRAPVAAP